MKLFKIEETKKRIDSASDQAHSMDDQEQDSFNDIHFKGKSVKT